MMVRAVDVHDHAGLQALGVGIVFFLGHVVTGFVQEDRGPGGGGRFLRRARLRGRDVAGARERRADRKEREDKRDPCPAP